jgi:hypothetical protein
MCCIVCALNLLVRAIESRMPCVPALGSGAIYPLSETDIVVPDFELPAHYPRAYALDVGWNKTAVVWGARDNETGVLYLYSEHYQGMKEASLHADAIKSRGPWIRGVVDPSARGRSQIDGQQLIEVYRQCGLDLWPAQNAVESGIYQTWQLMSSGKLKVFRSLGNWLREFRLYQRAEDGRIVKQDDHLMDATRYLIMSGRDRMRVKPGDELEQKLVYMYPRQGTCQENCVSTYRRVSCSFLKA